MGRKGNDEKVKTTKTEKKIIINLTDNEKDATSMNKYRILKNNNNKSILYIKYTTNKIFYIKTSDG